MWEATYNFIKSTNNTYTTEEFSWQDYIWIKTNNKYERFFLRKYHLSFQIKLKYKNILIVQFLFTKENNRNDILHEWHNFLFIDFKEFSDEVISLPFNE